MTQAQQKESIVKFDNVCMSFNGNIVLNNVCFEVFEREIVTIAGPSGSGKSTILKLITNLLAPDSGDIEVKTNHFGMAFQYAALFNSLSVYENIALALQETTKLSKRKIDERVFKSLDIVGLRHAQNMYPDELSGGMKKRVSIARALAVEPDILLYDEPSTGLDPATSAKLENDMVRLRNEIHVTSIVVTHDIATIKNVSDRVLILDKGCIAWQGTLNEFMSDTSAYPSSFRDRKPIEESKEG